MYVSLGTLSTRTPAFYARCFEAFAGRGSPGGAVYRHQRLRESRLGAAPANFIVMPHVPQLAVLQRARAFVTHGGMNSVSESLACGVPVVVIPQMGEQAIVGTPGAAPRRRALSDEGSDSRRNCAGPCGGCWRTIGSGTRPRSFASRFRTPAASMRPSMRSSRSRDQRVDR